MDEHSTPASTQTESTTDNVLGRYYSGFGLFRYALPNILMLIFTSMYCIVDGFFTARLVNTMAVGSLNIAFPIMSFLFALAYMLATGGCAIVARQMGQGRNQEARENFTFITLVTILSTVVFGIVGYIFLDPIVIWLGASELQFEQCCDYGLILFVFAPLCALQCLFQIFFVAAGHPRFGLFITLVAGISNMVLDYVFMGPLALGISGAGLATMTGWAIISITGLIFFSVRRKEPLHFVMPRMRLKMLGQTCINGSSEMVSNLAIAITTLLFNYYFMRFFAEDGVSAISIVLYIQFIFTAVFFGYSSGVAPIISYKYGHRDLPELRSIIRSGILFTLATSVLGYAISMFTIDYLLLLFVDTTDPVFGISRDGYPYFAPCLIFMGLSIYASALFTALSDGKTSALISFGRTFLFLVISIVLMSELLGANGAWGSTSVAEFAGCIVACICILRCHRQIRTGTGLFSASVLER